MCLQPTDFAWRYQYFLSIGVFFLRIRSVLSSKQIADKRDVTIFILNAPTAYPAIKFSFDFQTYSFEIRFVYKYKHLLDDLSDLVKKKDFAIPVQCNFGFEVNIFKVISITLFLTFLNLYFYKMVRLNIVI